MDNRSLASPSFTWRARRRIALFVHDRRLQTRLQMGSSLALGVGIFLSAAFLADLFGPLNSLLTGFLFQPNPPAQHAVLLEQDRLNQIVMVFLMALLAGATLPHCRFLPAAGLTILYFVAYLGYSYTLFGDGVLVQPLYPALGLVLTFLLTMIVRYVGEERRRMLLSRLFGRTVSPELVEQVVNSLDKSPQPLGGVYREVSLLSVDMRDFAGVLESLSPNEVMSLFDEYTRAIVSILFHWSGTVVEQTGKGVLAVWNLPLVQRDHARLAARAAVEIRSQVKTIAAKQPKEKAVRVGMGIATGCVAAGRTGLPSRPEYALIGEVVWLAERLSVKPDHSIFIDQATFDKVKDEFETREVNPVQLRRKTDPASAWEICEELELE